MKTSLRTKPLHTTLNEGKNARLVRRQLEGALSAPQDKNRANATSGTGGRSEVVPFRNRLSALTLVALCATFACTAASAMATPTGERTNFHLPVCEGSNGLIAAPRSGVLVSLCGKKGRMEGRTVANLLPDGSLVRYHVPRSEPGPIAVGPAREIWTVRALARKSFPERVYRIDPDGSLKSFPLTVVEESAKPSSFFEVRDLVVDPEGTVWVATADLIVGGYIYESYGGDLVRMAGDGSVKAFPLPQGEPENLAVGSDGNIWFTAVEGKWSGEHSSFPGTSLVGRITPAGEFAMFPTPIADQVPQAIAAAPEGELWFAEPEVGRIGTVAEAGTFGREYRVRFGLQLSYETAGMQGGLDFDSEGGAWMPAGRGGVGRLTPAGAQTLYPGPREVSSVAVGKEGDIWSLRRNEIRRIVPGRP